MKSSKTEIAEESEVEALEDAYSHWQGLWAHALDLGGFGDLFELRDALNAACPKDCKSS
jgi:hypothetical protein